MEDSSTSIFWIPYQFKKKAFLIVYLSLLFSCQSTDKDANGQLPSSSQQPKSLNNSEVVEPVKVINEAEALEQAFNSRGFTLSSLGNINYLQRSSCGGMTLQAHRGSVRHNENSVNAVIDALDNNFPVVEIDVRLTRDKVWVVHHDEETGRESGTIDNLERKISSTNYRKEWRYIRERNRHTGKLSETLPPSFLEIARSFSSHARLGQRLNIEIKGKYRKTDLQTLDALASKYVGTSRYFFSSIEFSNLEQMRELNRHVALHVIQRPAKRSIELLSSTLKKGAGDDPLYQQKKRKIASYERLFNRHYKEKRYDNASGLQRLTRSLGDHFALVLDIRHFAVHSDSFKRIAREYNVPLATYTINEHRYHAKELSRMNIESRPDYAIIDESMYGFCRHYDLPMMQAFEGLTDITRIMSQAPLDLDLQLLDLLSTYYPHKLYPAIDGSVKSIEGATHSDTPLADILGVKTIFLDAKAGPKESDTGVDLTREEALKIELRKADNKK